MNEVLTRIENLMELRGMTQNPHINLVFSMVQAISATPSATHK